MSNRTTCINIDNDTNKFKKIALVIGIALIIPIIPFAVIGELPGKTWLSATDHHALLFALTGFGLLTLDIALPIPSSIVATIMSARLGFLPGFFITWAGLTLGHVIGYLIGRFFNRFVQTTIPQIPSVILLIASRPAPVLAEAIALASGVFRLNFVSFFLSILIGNGLYALALSASGASFIPNTHFLLALVIPILLPAVTWWYVFKKIRR